MAQLSPALVQATPIVATRGQGLYLYDRDGRAYLDLTSGIGVTSTGHCHPDIVAAARKQVETLIHGQYGIVKHEPLLELMEKLGARMPSDMDAFFFANSGAEAVEASVRLARNATGRQNVLVFQGSFHGRTIGAAALTTSGARFRAAASGPLPPGVVVAPFPTPYRYGWDLAATNRFCLRELDHILATLSAPTEIAAILIEPVQGEAGYQPASAEFFAGLRKRADEHGILLITDEVQAGVARTGKFWAHEHFDVRPDIVVFAKGIASGFPLSGIAACRELMQKAAPGSQGGTFSANAVACAAAVATLDVIEKEGLVANAREMGQRLRDGLERTASRHAGIGNVRGLGLMQASEFVTADGAPDPAASKAVVAAALRRAMILLTCGPQGHIVRMIPALTINRDEIDKALEIWNASVDEVYGERHG
ncbi:MULTISPECIES: aspartate aminotransferase family protein [Paraburkholderia]|uniref:4-aminobutyrate aminotransferase GabT n=1 Tax=Paraburkholderia dioscoreae TaxID=2604047 RepID=A0A5Q4ZUT5_9BURK|nr:MULTISPECIES: aminotransferase class III-fold pyridoxal phosphate-dependent enzyme [Paraburkholderia]NPT33652.1 aminotransferase class III-fold pyridoxal phosphate-dependent enzyme [Paraburkholderia xenovorans]VVD33420.1 4-aminobutyrate aminotransferase GabT [Paraburkholderia dioscoreae]